MHRYSTYSAYANRVIKD